HAAGGAVLDDQAGMAVQHRVQPVQLGAVAGQKPGSGAQLPAVGSRAAVDVVVQLEVTGSQVAHQEVDRLVQVLNGGGVAQVQVVPAVLDHAPPAPGEERLGRQHLGDRAAQA